MARRHLSIGVLFLLIIFQLYCRVYGEELNSSSGFSLGFVANFGTNEIKFKESNAEIDTGWLMGGGVLIEKNLSQLFSIGSGIEYRYLRNNVTMYPDTANEFDALWISHCLSMPLHLILTLKGSSSSLDLHGGVTYTYIFSSKMTADDNAVKSDDAMKYIDASQIALSGGAIFRFLVTEWSDFFMGVFGEYYLTDYIHSTNDDRTYLLQYYFRSGYMFRTDIF